MRLVYRPSHAEAQVLSDTELLLAHCRAQGVEVGEQDARRAWRDHSARNGARWLPIPDDPEAAVRALMRYCTVA